MHIHRRSLRHATRIILAVWLFALGAGVANASYGLPDLGMTSMNDVLIDAERKARAIGVDVVIVFVDQISVVNPVFIFMTTASCVPFNVL